MPRGRRSFRWDQRVLIASAEASIRRLEKNPNTNAAYLGGLRSLLAAYKETRKP